MDHKIAISTLRMVFWYCESFHFIVLWQVGDKYTKLQLVGG
jgi:hypothetical protein